MQHRWHTQNIKLISACCTIRKHPHRKKFHVTLFFFFFFLAKIHNWQYQMFHKFMHSVTLFVLNQSKAQCRNVEPIFGFFISKILGRDIGQNLPSVLFWKKIKIIQTESKAFSFQFQQKTAFSPKYSQPWIIQDCCRSLPTSARTSTTCNSLPCSAHFKPWCMFRGSVLIRIPND